TDFAETCARSSQQTQTRAEPQLVGTHRQQLYATGIPIPTRPRPPHPPQPHPARRQPHPGPPPQPPPARATPTPPHPQPGLAHPHPPARPPLPKAKWPPPQPRPPQRADASELDSATAPPIAAITAITRIILRNIGASPSSLLCRPTPIV